MRGDGDFADTDPALEPARQALAPAVAALPAFNLTRQDWEGVRHILEKAMHEQPAADGKSRSQVQQGGCVVQRAQGSLLERRLVKLRGTL